MSNALDVAVTSRIRLARNFADTPFPSRMQESHCQSCIDKAFNAIEISGQGGQYTNILLREKTQVENRSLLERHLVSYDLIKNADRAAIILRDDNAVSIMVNEEDHIRIQALLPGQQTARAYELARNVDVIIGGSSPYAFDPEWGYLTSCPTNTGTGLRASVMLHLPALAITHNIQAIIASVAKLGMTVRGFYGEGSDAQGNLYQLSNQVTLGRSEEDIIQSLDNVCEQIIGHERRARDFLNKRNKLVLEDKLMRSVGVLTYARQLNDTEFMQLWSDARLASSLEMISVPVEVLDSAMINGQNAMLILHAGEDLHGLKRAKNRAEYMRGIMARQVEYYDKDNSASGEENK